MSAMLEIPEGYNEHTLLYDVDLPTRARNALWRHEVRSVGELVTLINDGIAAGVPVPMAVLIDLRGIGWLSARRILEVLRYEGFEIAGFE